MNFFLSLSLYDFRSTFRDPIFKFILFFPLIAYAIVAWLLPALIIQWPVLANYAPLILMWTCMQASLMFGFIYGFLFLEEKEEHLTEALRITPISSLKLVFARLFIGILISFGVSWMLLRFGNVVHLPAIKEILLSIQFSLGAPLITLLVAAYPKNRIEGMAQMKVVNLILNLPALIYFLPFGFLHFTAIIPTYWAFRSTELAIEDSSWFYGFVFIGIVYHFAVIFFLNRKLEKCSNG